MTENKKFKLPSEVVYFAAIILLSFAVALTATTDFGISMIVAPAYILSQKIGLSFGQCEYILQGVLFIVFCICMKRVKAVYFSSFITCLIYGAVLDLWRYAVPFLNPSVTPPGSMAMPVRVVCFAVGVLLTSLSIALFFRIYLYPQVYDFFVKGISSRFHLNRTKFKVCFDSGCLVVSCLMTLIFFGSFVGVGIGTIIMTLCNGWIIGFFDRLLGRLFVFEPLLPKFAQKFAFK